MPRIGASKPVLSEVEGLALTGEASFAIVISMLFNRFTSRNAGPGSIGLGDQISYFHSG